MVNDALQRVQSYEPLEITPKQKCEQSGGTWDEATKRCLRTTREIIEANIARKEREKPKPLKPPKPYEGTPSMRIRVKSGEPTLTPTEKLEAEKLEVERIKAARGGIGAAEALETKEAQTQEAQRVQEIINQMGLTPQEITALQSLPMEQASIDWSQAFAAGTLGNIPSIATRVGIGAVAGAKYGTAVLPGIGTLGGAAAGSVLGFVSSVWGGVQRNIAVQQRGEIGASKDVLTNAKTNMMKLSRLAMTDPSRADNYAAAYDYWLGQVYLARRKIKLETEGDLNSFMEDGRDILSDFDLFLMPDVGTAAIYKDRIAAALLQEVAPEMMIAQMIEEMGEE